MKYQIQIRDVVIVSMAVLMTVNYIADNNYRSLLTYDVIDTMLQAISSLQDIHLEDLKHEIFENEYETHVEYEKQLLLKNERLNELIRVLEILLENSQL